jgi:hypothetical protein
LNTKKSKLNQVLEGSWSVTHSILLFSANEIVISWSLPFLPTKIKSSWINHYFSNKSIDVFVKSSSAIRYRLSFFDFSFKLIKYFIDFSIQFLEFVKWRSTKLKAFIDNGNDSYPQPPVTVPWTDSRRFPSWFDNQSSSSNSGLLESVGTFSQFIILSIEMSHKVTSSLLWLITIFQVYDQPPERSRFETVRWLHVAP